MRHLLNTYIQADPADPLSAVDNFSLVELIIQTGVHDAIAKKLNAKGNLSKDAIAEGIINNVRKTIIREQLTDPRFYEGMSRLLEDLIKQSRDDAAAYEEFHLLEPTHNERFISILTEHYPTWREARAELNELPLTAEVWRE
ncbi:YgjP-like metallopeptidase domain-containing protein [Pseudomonas sp. GWSMS-1]|uniref:YgjP-like metallopeptidase domain-containing protein n=1 Tax=Pseudomonas sp. GWSMS-1 TaxID=3308997 RepID=UPI003CF8F3F0